MLVADFNWADFGQQITSGLASGVTTMISGPPASSCAALRARAFMRSHAAPPSLLSGGASPPAPT